MEYSCVDIQEDDTGKQAFLNVYGVGVNTAASFNWSSIAGNALIMII